MHHSDLVRELEKAHVALGHAAAHLQRTNEANAILHLAGPGGVMWSPLTTEVVNAHRSLGSVIERLQAQQDDDHPDAPKRLVADALAPGGIVPDGPRLWDGTSALKPQVCVNCDTPDADVCTGDEAGVHHPPTEAEDG